MLACIKSLITFTFILIQPDILSNVYFEEVGKTLSLSLALYLKCVSQTCADFHAYTTLYICTNVWSAGENRRSQQVICIPTNKRTNKIFGCWIIDWSIKRRISVRFSISLYLTSQSVAVSHSHRSLVFQICIFIACNINPFTLCLVVYHHFSSIFLVFGRYSPVFSHQNDV